MKHRRLHSVSLSDPVSDPANRHIMHMSTVIASDLWLIETSWDGSGIGDIQIFMNAACSHNGNRMWIDGPEVDAKGRPIQIPAPDKWVWWRGVPKGKVSSYAFADDDCPAPATLKADLPFQVDHAEREAKPDQADKNVAQAGGRPKNA